MPLVRLEVKSEYGLGAPELYKDVVEKEDPKAVLDGVAVSGLVGILRQLGDLAEFAAEVFHGIQEQVTTTASRSHKLMVRVQRIEAAVPSLEKAVLAQTSHIHFAYTAGREWHPRIPMEQNHFIYSDLPRFIMDSYEECRDPPQLHLLDKFDTGGPGSCLKRYSDPTYFRRASSSPIEAKNETQKDKKNHRSKKRRSSQRSRDIARVACISNQNSRRQLTSLSFSGRTSSQTVSTVDMAFKSDLQDHSNSFDSRSGSGYIEVFNRSSSVKPDEKLSKESSSSRSTQHANTIGSVFDGRSEVVDDNFPYCPSQEQPAPRSSCVSWDEKVEIVDDEQGIRDEAAEMLETDFVLDAPDKGAANGSRTGRVGILSNDIDSTEHIPSMNHLNDIGLVNGQQGIRDEAAEMLETDSVLDAPDKGRDEAAEMLETYFVLDAPDKGAANGSGTGRVGILSNDMDSTEQIRSANNLSDIGRGQNIESEREIEGEQRSESGPEIESEKEIESELEIEGELETENGLEIKNEPELANKPEIKSELETESELENDSEADNFVDALNTIESDSENDLEYPTKRELEKYSCNVKKHRSEDVVHERMESRPEYHWLDDTKHEVQENSSNAEKDGSEGVVLEHMESRSGYDWLDETKQEVRHNLSNVGKDGSEVIAHESMTSSPDYDRVDETKQEVQESSRNVEKNRSEVVLHESVARSSDNNRVDEIKQEVQETSSNVGNDRLEEAAHEAMGCSPENDHSMHIASDICKSEGTSCSLLEPTSSDFSAEQIPQLSGKSLDSNDFAGTHSFANGNIHNGSIGESVIAIPSISAPGASISDLHPLLNRIINGTQEPREPQVGTSNIVPSVKIWTNGGLLGLEPSKPPVFAVPISASQGTKTEDGVNAPPNEQNERTSKSMEIAQGFQKFPSSTSKKVSQPTDCFSHAKGAALDKTTAVTPGTVTSSDIKNILTGIHHENNEMLSGVFGLSHRLLMNGFSRKEPFSHDMKSVSSSIQKACEGTEPTKVRGQAIQWTTFKEALEHDGTPFDWFASSPPLEHMKISFSPADRLQVSNLKLKFPDRVQCHESDKNTFPSFQLVPEPATSLRDNFTDSDDDTFCRSSPYMSDDCLSDNNSELNSELWEESGESPGRKDYELYDALRGMLTADSVPGSLPIDGHRSMHVENGVEPSLSGPLLDVPSFDAVEPSFSVGREDNSDAKNLMNQRNSMDPIPKPALSPVQWQVSKPSSEGFEDKQQALQDSLKHALNQRISLSSGSEQPLASQISKMRSNEVSATSKPENKVHQKLNREENGSEGPDGKDADKGDFLHQIRTKQFNLRRTVSATPSAPTGPTTNVNFNAILEKANAIRQAVASDDGDETDTWSDT